MLNLAKAFSPAFRIYCSALVFLISSFGGEILARAKKHASSCHRGPRKVRGHLKTVTQTGI
jgi:hypothetical protein